MNLYESKPENKWTRIVKQFWKNIIMESLPVSKLRNDGNWDRAELVERETHRSGTE